MDFLEKLNYLMKKNKLNKNTLSKTCNIPYTTIDGWYKKGYEGLKLPTLRKLSNFFGTTLDYWADDQLLDPEDLKINDNYLNKLSPSRRNLIADLEKMSDNEINAILAFINSLEDVANAMSNKK